MNSSIQRIESIETQKELIINRTHITNKSKYIEKQSRRVI